MQIFLRLYNWVIAASKHPNALYYLALVSFIDSSFFPISPMFMLVPMAYAKPNQAFLYAGVSTISSIFGGLLGYALGLFAFEALVEPFLTWMGYINKYNDALIWFQGWGFWAVLLASFSPIPYKIFTIGAGVLQLNVLGFLLASGIGRGLRFFITAWIVRWGGPRLEPLVKRFLVKESGS